jgi:CheY-like chemotaxis protein
MDPIKILLVDDSKSARYALRLQLQRYGIQVDTAESAEAALERIGEAPPDAILMDHTMPGMNGFEALEILKSDLATAHIPVVMCTSHDDSVFSAQAIKRGALSVLTKAVAAEKLPQILEQIRTVLTARTDYAWTSPPPAEEFASRPAPAPAPAPAPTPVPPEAPNRVEIEAWVDAYLGQRVGEAIEPHIGRLTTQLRQVIAEQVEMAVDALPAPVQAPQPVAQPLAAPASAIDLDVLREDIIPTAVRHHFNIERDRMMQLMQQCAQEAQVQHANDWDAHTLRKILQTVDATATTQSVQVARREAKDAVAAALAREREALAALRRGLRLSYGLAAAALLLGVGSAAAVFLR